MQSDRAMGRNLPSFWSHCFGITLVAILVCPSDGARFGPSGINYRELSKHSENLNSWVPKGTGLTEPSESSSDDFRPLIPKGPDLIEPPKSSFDGFKSLVPKEPDLIEPLESPSDDFKRLVPKGPDPIEPPESFPYDLRCWISKGPDPVEQLENPYEDLKRLVPKGPDPIEPPESSPDDLRCWVSSSSDDLRGLVPEWPNHEQPSHNIFSKFEGTKRRNIHVPTSAPSGPNPELPQDSPSIRGFGGTKRNVPPPGTPSHVSILDASDGTYHPDGAIPQQRRESPYFNGMRGKKSLFKRALSNSLLHKPTPDAPEGLERLVPNGLHLKHPPESRFEIMQLYDVPFPHKGSP